MERQKKNDWEKKVNNEMLFCGEGPINEILLRFSLFDYHANMKRRSSEWLGRRKQVWGGEQHKAKQKKK